MATRRDEAVAEPIGTELDEAATATSTSAVSRRVVIATEQTLAERSARDRSRLEVAVVMIEGIELADEYGAVSFVITAGGTMVPIGLWLGGSENATVVTNLLADLEARGLSTTTGVLVGIDGVTALAAGSRRVVGEDAEVRRCTLHTRRHVADHLPKELEDRRLPPRRRRRARRRDDRAQAWDGAPRSAHGRPSRRTGAPPEGLEDRFTVRRLGITGRVAKSLTTTNAVESMISIARRTARNVTRRRDGEMTTRWVAAGERAAECSLRRMKGHCDLPKLLAALRASRGSTAAPPDCAGSAAGAGGITACFTTGRDTLWPTDPVAEQSETSGRP